MTTVTCTKSRKAREIVIAGHAEYGKPDIVCSALSMLTYTLAARLKEAECSLMDGDAHIFLAGANKEDDIAIDTIMTGYKLLAEEYPKNVKVVEYE